MLDANYVNKIMNDKSLYEELPDNVSLILGFNNDCNCHCKFCFLGKHISRDNSHRLVMPKKWLYEYMLPLYEKTATLDPVFGEITACNEGYEYLSFLNEKYHHINLFTRTNGIVFNDKWSKLAVNSLMRVHFSINAINEEYYKKTVYDKDGIYLTVQKNFNHYLELLKEHNLFAFKPSVSMVINPKNFETVREFIKQYVSKGIQVIYILFDVTEFGYRNFAPETEEVKDVLITLLELEKVLVGKVAIMLHRLYAPTNNMDKYDEIVNNKNIDELKEKYSDILDLTSDFPSIKELKNQRNRLRKEYGKKELVMCEDVTGYYSPHYYMGKTICGTPYNAINIHPTGYFSACNYLPMREKITSYIKDDKIDWNEVFNSFHFRNLRYNFRNGVYSECLPNCQGKIAITKSEFEKFF